MISALSASLLLTSAAPALALNNDPSGTELSEAALTAQNEAGAAEAQNAVADAPPYLRWNAVGATGEPLAGVTFVIEASRASSPATPEVAADANDEKSWDDAMRATVLDNTGQADYVGADLDPAAGSFLVKTLVSDADTSQTHTVVAGDDVRVRPELAEGHVAGETATWQVLSATENAEEPVAELQLQQLEDEVDGEPDANPDVPAANGDDAAEVDGEPGAQTKSKSKAKASDKTEDISALTAQEPDGASAPYLHWNVVDETGAQVPGATFSFERRVSNWLFTSWGGTRSISDCVTGSCNGVDRDNDPADYLVKWIGSNTPGANPTGTGADNVIQADARYRVKAVNPPAGYAWVGGTGWTDSNNLTWGGSEGNRTLNFGTFTVKKVSYAPSCVAGNVYGIRGSGQIMRVLPGGAVETLGDKFGSTSYDFNGLGIGTGGSPTYAYSRGGKGDSDGKVSIYSYSSETGKWSDTDVDVSSDNNKQSMTFVAGAVNLDTGSYFLGGFDGEGNRRVFRLWEYDPEAKPSVTYKGSVSAPGEGTANGDIAFDANGNLFIVRGSGTTTTVYSVTASNLASAKGDTIASAVSKEVSKTTSNVNGVAFDADGLGYISNGTYIDSYKMPGWTDKKRVTNNLSSSNDLASCGSPPTISLEKVVEGARVIPDTDQFTLNLTQGATVIGTATTTGNETELQAERVGPLPTVRGTELTFSETASGTTDLDNYVSSYRCLVDGVQTVQGNGTTGKITIPDGGQEVECQFYNAPLAAQVTIHKDIADGASKSLTPKEGWPVGATVTATTGIVRDTSPSARAETKTDAEGDATWTYRFDSKAAVATVSVHEVLGTEHSFQSGDCVITHLDGTQKDIELKGPTATDLIGIVPGDRVECGYVNRLLDTNLTLVKTVDNQFGGTAQSQDWTLTAKGETEGVTGITGDEEVTNRAIAAGTYVLSESDGPSGYTPKGWVCTSADSDDALVMDGDRVTIPAGAATTCTITNADLPGEVEWSKVDTAANLLAGSEWTLTGPKGFAEMNISEKTCLVTAGTDNAPYCSSTESGKFALANLPWGEYQLEETKAPAGYIRDTEKRAFTITGDALTGLLVGTDGNAVVNRAIPSPAIPLSGGIGSDFFSIMGAGVLTVGVTAASVLMIRGRRKEI